MKHYNIKNGILPIVDYPALNTEHIESSFHGIDRDDYVGFSEKYVESLEGAYTELTERVEEMESLYSQLAVATQDLLLEFGHSPSDIRGFADGSMGQSNQVSRELSQKLIDTGIIPDAVHDMEVKKAFTDALALESVQEELHEVDSDYLIEFARTVAYKVFHNLKQGYEMDKDSDPLTVNGKPAPEAWPTHYEKRS